MPTPSRLEPAGVKLHYCSPLTITTADSYYPSPSRRFYTHSRALARVASPGLSGARRCSDAEGHGVVGDLVLLALALGVKSFPEDRARIEHGVRRGLELGLVEDAPGRVRLLELVHRVLRVLRLEHLVELRTHTKRKIVP